MCDSKRRWRWMVPLLLLLQLTAAASRTILAVPMFARDSPSLDVMAVAGELQNRGYNILTTAHDEDIAFLEEASTRHQHGPPEEGIRPGNITFVTVRKDGTNFKQVIERMFSQAHTEGLSIPKHTPELLRSMSRPCGNLLRNRTAMRAIRRAKPSAILSFDLPFGPDSCGCMLSHALRLPLVLADGNPMIMGPLSVPQPHSGLTIADLSTPTGFLKNLGMYVAGRVIFSLGPRLFGEWSAERKAAGLEPMHHYGGCAPAVHLHLKSFLLEYPRPLAPGHIMLGPSSPRPARPAEHQQQSQPEVWSFMEDADPDAGVALVGMGSSGLFGKALVPEDWKALAGAFTDLAPTRVIWPLLPSNLPVGVQLEDLHLGSNVLVVPWVDYNDVLGHPNTKLFISHTGVHSMYEAAFHGVPIVAVPFIYDQQEAAAKMAARGLGEVCWEAFAYRTPRNPLVFKRDKLAAIARQVLTTPSYYKAMANISAQLQAHAAIRPATVRAADEIEVLLAASSPWRQIPQRQPYSGRGMPPAAAAAGPVEPADEF